MQTQQTAVTAQAAAQAAAPQSPAANTAYGPFANFAKAQAQKAAAQAARLAAATYTLVRPGNAHISRNKPGATQAQQAAVNANLAARLVLQLYPLVAQSGLTPAQAAQVSQHLLQSVYTLQQAAHIAPAKQAVQLVLPPK